MAISILNKELIENYDMYQLLCKNIKLNNLFSLGGISFDLSNILLSDFDSNNFQYSVDRNEIKKIFSLFNNHYFSVVPIEKFTSIKNDCKIISESDDILEIEYGVHVGNECSDYSMTNQIYNIYMKGGIEKTDNQITFLLDKDGNKLKVSVYKIKKTGEKFISLSANGTTICDDIGVGKPNYVFQVQPLRWVVDKKSGIAVANNPIMYAQPSGKPYNESKLCEFLQSYEFKKELQVSKSGNKNFTSPFAEKNNNELSLEEVINRTLIGGTRIPYLVGHPGVGKTQVVKSINPNVLSYNIGTFTPDAFTGKTSIVPGKKTIVQEGNITYETNEAGRTELAEPQWHKKLVEMSEKCKNNNERCVLFLDEFDKLTPNMQVFVNGIVDSPRTIAGWEIPDNVDLILAGNTEEYSDASFNISGEVASRLTKINVKPNTNDWLRWANGHDVDPIVKSYIQIHPEKMIVDCMGNDGSYDPSISLTPRSWDQKISEELKAARKLNCKPYLEPYMSGKERDALEEFINIYFQLGVEEIIKGNVDSIDISGLTPDMIQMTINCLIAVVRTEEELYYTLKFLRNNNLKEYLQLFKGLWVKINSNDNNIIDLRIAEEQVEDERVVSNGK